MEKFSFVISNHSTHRANNLLYRYVICISINYFYVLIITATARYKAQKGCKYYV